MADKLSLLDLAITLAKHKKLILGAPFIAAVISALLSLTSPDIYTADTQILPPKQQSSALGALSGMAGAAGGITNPNDTYIAMLKSRTLRDNMIRRYKLQSVYKTGSMESARAALEGATTIKIEKNGLIVISVDDTNPKRAAFLADGYVDQLQQLNQVFAVSQASQSRLFIEKQLKQAKQSLIDAEIALKLLQEKTGTIKLDTQAEQAIATVANIKAQIAMKEAELASMRSFATGSNPDYIRAEQQLHVLRTQINKVEAGTVPSKNIPENVLEYIRKTRDLKYAENIYEMLTKQFEIAKIDEAKESSVIQVLDRALVPEHRSKPNRSKSVLITALAAGLLSILWAFIIEAMKSSQQEIEKQKQLQLLRKYLRWK